MAERCPSAGERILVVIGSLDRGGTEGHLLQVLPRLCAGRFTPEVFTLAARGQLADVMERHGVRVHGPWLRGGLSRNVVYRGFRIALVAVQLWVYMLRWRPKIVHFFLPASYLIGLPVAMLARVRLRVMSRRSLNRYQRARPLLARFEHRLHRATTAIVGNSNRVMQELLHEEHVPAERAVLIYNGVVATRILAPAERSFVRASLDLHDNELVIVAVANLIRYKGHTDLLRACALAMASMRRSWKLLVVGRDDGIGPELMHLCAELGLDQHVRFLGERADVAGILGIADIATVVSREEGFSNAVLEAMAAGLPLVVTNVGGNTEAVLHGETGLIVPARNPEAIAEALVRLAKDKTARAKMGAAARDRALNLFGLERCVAAYERLYTAILSGTPVGSAGELIHAGTHTPI